MRNSTCVICFKEFEPREGKLYCSNACKQKGYADKKANSNAMNEKKEEQTKQEKKLQFYFAEYQEYIKKYPESIHSFLLFCFFRKNFVGAFNAEQFNEYIKSFPPDWWEDFWNKEDNPARKKYYEFEEKYFTNDNYIHL